MTRPALHRFTPPPADIVADRLDFTPVPRRCNRRDGWTPARQRGFIEALADTGSVADACRAVGMATEGAYMLRRAAAAESFSAAWEAAVEIGAGTLLDIAMQRVRDGIEVPVFWRGEQCGSRRWYDNRLLMFLLRHRLPEKFGAQTGAARSREAEALAEREPHIDDVFAKLREQIVALREPDLCTNPALAFAPNPDYQSSFKAGIAHDPAKRAAWELLVGSEDWDAPADATDGDADEVDGEAG